MRNLRHLFADFAGLPRDLKLVVAALFAIGLSEGLYLHLLALYLERLGATPVRIGNTFALAYVAQACVSLPGGLLADRWGRKQVILTGLIIGFSSVCLMALATSLPLFSVGMIAYWLTGMILPALSSYTAAVRGSLPPERALTITSAGWGLGTVATPTLGGWIAGAYGFRPLFALAASAYVLALIAVALLRRHPAAPRGARAHFERLLANRRFLAFCGLIALVWFVVFLSLPLVPNYLADVRGLTVAQIGLLGTINAIGLTALSLTLGRQPPRRGFLLTLLAFGLFLALMLGASWIGWLMLAYFLRPAAFVARTLAEARATRVVPRAQWGIAFGILETVATAAGILAPLAAGRLYVLNPARPMQASLILLPGTMILAYFFMRQPAEPEADEALEGAEA